MLDEPSVVLLAATAAAICLLLEVALPTAGLAGGAGLALAFLSAWGAERQGDPWWPLLGVVAAVAVWGSLIALHRRPVGAQVTAAALFLAGALGYAISTSDLAAAITAVVAAALLAGFVFPRIAAGSDRLTDAPNLVGMESLVGATANVAEWSGTQGSVVVGGTRWSATGPANLVAGSVVRVKDTTGLSLIVEDLASQP